MKLGLLVSAALALLSGAPSWATASEVASFSESSEDYGFDYEDPSSSLDSLDDEDFDEEDYGDEDFDDEGYDLEDFDDEDYDLEFFDGVYIAEGRRNRGGDNERLNCGSNMRERRGNCVCRKGFVQQGRRGNCVRAPRCDRNARLRTTSRGAHCECNRGFSGDGTRGNCTPDITCDRRTERLNARRGRCDCRRGFTRMGGRRSPCVRDNSRQCRGMSEPECGRRETTMCCEPTRRNGRSDYAWECVSTRGSRAYECARRGDEEELAFLDA